MRSILLINTTRFQINLISNKLIINELPPPPMRYLNYLKLPANYLLLIIVRCGYNFTTKSINNN